MRHGQKTNKRYATIQTSQTELSCILLAIRLLESELIIISVNQMRGLRNKKCEKSRCDFMERPRKVKPYLRLVSCKVNKNLLKILDTVPFLTSPLPPTPPPHPSTSFFAYMEKCVVRRLKFPAAIFYIFYVLRELDVYLAVDSVQMGLLFLSTLIFSYC